MKIEGREYISSSRAAEITHYTSDYIGQLCRGGKLSAQIVGRSWFIEVESLDRYQEAIKTQLHKEKKIQAVQKELAIKKVSAQTTSPVSVAKFVDVPAKEELSKEKESIINSSSSAFPPLAWKIVYAEDDRSLLPTLNKKTEVSRPVSVKDKKALISEQVKSIFEMPEGFAKLAVAIFLLLGVVTVSTIAAIGPDSFKKTFVTIGEFTDETLGYIHQNVSLISGTALSMTWSDFDDAFDVVLDNTVKPVANVVVALVPDIDISSMDFNVNLSLPTIPVSKLALPDATPMLAAVGDIWDSSITWVSDIFGTAARKVVALVTFPNKITIVQESTTPTPQNILIRTPVAPTATSSIVAVVPKAVVSSQTIYSNTERVIEPRTTIINAVDQALLDRIVTLENHIASGFLISRPFETRQTNAIFDSVDRGTANLSDEINALDTRIEVLEADGGSSTIDTSTAHNWTALQQFSNSSSTLSSVYGALYVGTTATTTILGTATSTFGAGIQTSYLNVTGTSATSTFARGIDLSGGCFSINGTCVGGGSSSQWTTSGSDVYYTTGNVGIGTTSPYAKLSVVGQAVAAYFTATTTTASTFPYASTTALSVSNLTSGRLTYATTGGLLTDSGSLTFDGTKLVTTYASTTALTSSGSAYFATAGGAVGIGTTSLYAKLGVTGDGTGTGIAFAIANSSNASKFTVADNGGTAIAGTLYLSSNGLQFGNSGGIAGSNLGFLAPTSDGVFRFGDSAGGGSPRIILGSASSGWVSLLRNGAGLDIKLGDNSGYASTTAANFNGIGNSASFFKYASTTALTSSGSAYFATAGGAVGIGTTSPGTILSIGNTGNDTINISATATSTFGSGLNLRSGCFSINGTCISGSGGSSSQWTTTGSDIYYTTGKVGIGTTSPYAKLSIEGSSVLGNSALAGYFTATTTTASTFPYASTTALSVSNLTSGRLTYATTGGLLTDSGSLTFDGTKFITTYASTTALTSSGSAYFATAGGAVGIGTTSPGTILSIGNTGNDTINISATATSTFGSGLNLRSGCFSINGTCVGGGSSSQWTTTGSDVYYTTGNVGIGTTSPYAKLSVVGQAVAAYFTATTTTASTFPYASTTALSVSGTAYFPGSGIWTSAGFLGIGTTSPYAALSVVGEAVARNFTATSTTATSTFAGGFNANSGALVSDFTTGITSISSLETGSFSFDTDAGMVSWSDLTVTSAAVDTPQGYTAFINGNPMLTLYSESIGTGGIKKTAVGIGTSTPFALLSVQNNAFAASSTYSFVIASTTSALTPSIHFAVTNAGNVGIGTTSPWRSLSVNGTAAFTSLTNDSTGYYVCLNTTTYNLSTSTSACGASSQRFKENVQTLSYGLNIINQLKPVSFDWKADFMPRSTSTRQIGFIAEQVATLIPELVTYDSTGQIMNLDYPKLTAVLVNAIQQQQLQINSLIAGSSTPSVNNGNSESNNAPQTALEVLTTKVNELSLRIDLFATSTATSTLVATSSSEFMASIVNSVRELIQSTGEWFVQKITATLAIFNRVETQTAAISNGLEITDSVTGDIWCMRIASGEWDKTKGSCAEKEVITNTPSVNNNPVIATTTAIIKDQVSTTTPIDIGLDVATTTATTTTTAPTGIDLDVATTTTPIDIDLDVVTTTAPTGIDLVVATTTTPIDIDLDVVTTTAPIDIVKKPDEEVVSSVDSSSSTEGSSVDVPENDISIVVDVVQ